MSVNSGAEREYEKRHDPIWAEYSEKVLEDHGVLKHSIFLHSKAHQLFGCAEIGREEEWSSIALKEACQRWWQHMGDAVGWQELVKW